MMNRSLVFIITLCIAFVSFLVGWLFGQKANSMIVSSSPTQLRSDGYEYIKPLLLSDFGDENTSSKLKDLERHVNAEINAAINKKAVDSVSLFYRDLNTNEQLYINPNEKYFPASLSKVPVMMAYYKLAENNPSLLDERGQLNFETDYNANQEIKPTKQPVSGEEYSIQELINMMIVNSDNTGFQLLMSKPGTAEAMKKMFVDLQLYFPYEQTNVKDVISAKEFARFLRVLYNSTYLNADNSDRALALMSQSDYRNGIVAGVPSKVKVAHKYGLNTYRDLLNGAIIERQLHDCGIVYRRDSPYLLCIMTKSSKSELQSVEQFIAGLSNYVYSNLPN